MAGIVIEYARFVEVQQRRERIIAELLLPPETTPTATSESRRQFRSTRDDAVQLRASADRRGHQ